MLSVLPLSHVFERVVGLLLAFRSGARIVYFSSTRPRRAGTATGERGRHGALAREAAVPAGWVWCGRLHPPSGPPGASAGPAAPGATAGASGGVDPRDAPFAVDCEDCVTDPVQNVEDGSQEVLLLALQALALGDVADDSDDEEALVNVQGLRLISTGSAAPSRRRARSCRPRPHGAGARGLGIGGALADVLIGEARGQQDLRPAGRATRRGCARSAP